MKTLVVGTGFLGKSIVLYLLKNTKCDDIYTISRSEFDYHKHTVVDLLALTRLKEVINRIKPDLIYNASGNASNKPNEENPSQVLIDNIVTFNNLLSCLENKPVVIHVSSVTVFGKFSKRFPAYYLTKPNPISLYSVSKLSQEHLLNTYIEQGRVRGVSIRIPALVGKNSTHGFLHDLILKLKGPDKTLNLIGASPGSIKPFQDADEVADIICKIGIHFNDADYNKDLPVMIGNEDSLSCEEIAHLVMDELGIQKEIVWSGSSWVGDQSCIYISPDLYPKSNSTETIIKYVRELV